MKIFNFRCYRQKEAQSLDKFFKELRKLAKDWEFNNTDNEILSQIIENCKSNQLRRRALWEWDKTLQYEIIQVGRAMEMSNTQSSAMGRPNTSSVNRVHKKSKKLKKSASNRPRSDRLHRTVQNPSTSSTICCWKCLEFSLTKTGIVQMSLM